MLTKLIAAVPLCKILNILLWIFIPLNWSTVDVCGSEVDSFQYSLGSGQCRPRNAIHDELAQPPLATHQQLPVTSAIE